MSKPKGVSIKGGAATAISPEGAIRLVFNLDESWLNQIQQHIPFDPTLSDLKISIKIQAGDTTSTFSINHQTWPTSHTHNGQTHIFDETSPIRLTSVVRDGSDFMFPQGQSAEVWKAKWLIGKEWQEDEKTLDKGKGKGKQVSDQRPTASTSAPGRDDDAQQSRKRVSADESERNRDKKRKTVDNVLSGLSPPPQDTPPLRDSHAARDCKGHIVGDHRAGSHHLTKSPSHNRSAQAVDGSGGRVLWVMFTDGTSIPFRIRATTKLAKLRVAIADRVGTDVNGVHILFAGQRIKEDQTAEDLNFWDEMSPPGDGSDGNEVYLEVLLEQCGGKPVIYLYPPSRCQLMSNSCCVPNGNISAVYPPTPVLTFRPSNEQSKEDWERVKWNVDARVDGSMVDKATGLEVSYLFWEAETNPTTAGTQEHTKMQNAGPRLLKSFDPSYTRLHPDQANVVVMKSSDVSIYLDRALKALGLHTEARTSFITYWLPHYQRHSHVALTFVPQDLYSESAPLEIAPTPDIVTRVFMLFGKVNPDQLQAWSDSVKKAEEDVMFWRDVVGVAEREKQEDKGLFRVVEWGGMEIR